MWCENTAEDLPQDSTPASGGGGDDVSNRQQTDKTRRKINVSAWKRRYAHVEDTFEDVERVCGDKSRNRWRCAVNKKMWSPKCNQLIMSCLSLLQLPSPESSGGFEAVLLRCACVKENLWRKSRPNSLEFLRRSCLKRGLVNIFYKFQIPAQYLIICNWTINLQ